MTDTQTGTFNDMTHDEEQDILYGLLSLRQLLAMGDVYSIAREELNNEILATWAVVNNRCTECGDHLNDDGECANDNTH